MELATMSEVAAAKEERDRRNAVLPPPEQSVPENGYWDPSWCGPGSGINPIPTPEQVEAQERIRAAWLARCDGQGVKGPSPGERELEREVAERVARQHVGG